MLTDTTAEAYEQARLKKDAVWERTHGGDEYDAALLEYDAAVAQWNKECRQ